MNYNAPYPEQPESAAAARIHPVMHASALPESVEPPLPESSELPLEEDPEMEMETTVEREMVTMPHEFLVPSWERISRAKEARLWSTRFDEF